MRTPFARQASLCPMPQVGGSQNTQFRSGAMGGRRNVNLFGPFGSEQHWPRIPPAPGGRAGGMGWRQEAALSNALPSGRRGRTQNSVPDGQWGRPQPPGNSEPNVHPYATQPHNAAPKGAGPVTEGGPAGTVHDGGSAHCSWQLMAGAR